MAVTASVRAPERPKAAWPGSRDGRLLPPRLGLVGVLVAGTASCCCCCSASNKPVAMCELS